MRGVPCAAAPSAVLLDLNAPLDTFERLCLNVKEIVIVFHRSIVPKMHKKISYTKIQRVSIYSAAATDAISRQKTNRETDQHNKNIWEQRKKV